jgi:hypothetical protein
MDMIDRYQQMHMNVLILDFYNTILRSWVDIEFQNAALEVPYLTFV